MGGAVSAAFAAANPEYINKIVLIDPVYSPQKISLLRFPVIGEFIAYLFKIPHFPEIQMTDFHRPERFPEWSELYREQMKYRGFRRAILSTLRNFLSRDPLAYYESIKLNKKVLLIWGKEDKVTPFSDGEKLKSLLSPEFLSIDEAGHLPHYEKPEIVNDAIIEFLKPDLKL
jgi:pimeloyl-ACP methyl ester carboxylesterase